MDSIKLKNVIETLSNVIIVPEEKKQERNKKTFSNSI